MKKLVLLGIIVLTLVGLISIYFYSTSSNKLQETYLDLQSEGILVECHSYDDCFSDTFSEEELGSIAIKYGIIGPSDVRSKIYIALLKGSSIRLSEIRKGNKENKPISGFDNEKMYWELGACATNKRVYIDANTSEIASPIHSHVYCTNTNIFGPDQDGYVY